MTDLDLIWVYVKSLVEELMSSEENMLDLELFERYDTAFNQLMQIIDNPETHLSEEKLADIKFTLAALENKFKEYQSRIQDSIIHNRIKSKVANLYSHPFLKSSGYFKKS